MTPQELNDWLAAPTCRCLIMGVLNVTPDSFSDGGRYFDTSAACAHAQQMIADGADLLDIGGESTRPGSEPVAEAEQLRRVLPVIAAIKAQTPTALSIDSTRVRVAREALDAGACMINDISAGTDDPGILELAARHCVPIALMHMQGKPRTMQVSPSYNDVVAEIIDYLRARMNAALETGVAREKILLDPGIGFGKKLSHNVRLLRELRHFLQLGAPLLLGVSRKSFVGKITGEDEQSQRPFGTAAAVAWSVANGAAIVRVHDVGPMRAVVKMTEAMMQASGTD